MVQGSNAALLAGLVVLALFAVPPGAAQAADAPPISLEENKLYVHHKTGTDELKAWMSTLAKDPAGDDTELGPSGALTSSRTYTIDLTPGLNDTVTLDEEGTINLTVYVGSSSGVGSISVRTAIGSGNTSLATGEAKSMTMLPSSGMFGSLKWTLTPKASILEAGTNLTWTITVSGTASSVALGVSETRGKTFMELPVLSAAVPTPELQAFDLTGDSAEIVVEMQNATTTTHQYNWTSNLTSAQADFFADVLNGSVGFEVVDGGNMTVLTGSINETGADVLEIEGAVAGDWLILLNFTEFRGYLEFTIQPSANATLPGNLTGNATGNATVEGEGGGIPSLGTVLVVSGALVAAVGTRRRTGRRRP